MNRFVISAWLCLATSASAQENVGPDYSGSYLCKTKASSGIAPGKDEIWRATTLDVTDDAYVVKLIDTKKTVETWSPTKARVYNVGVKKFGSNDEFDDCFSGRLNKAVASETGEIECHHLWIQYFFDFHTMRFQVMFEGDYMDRAPSNRDAPFISIGECDKIE